MHREIERLIESQGRWATPTGEAAQRVLTALYTRCRPLKDVLNGVWLGHPLHPALTDVPVGAFSVATLLDLSGQHRGADVATATGVAAMMASAAAGTADAVDAYGPPVVPTTVHASLMVGSLGLYLASLWLRLTRPAARPLAIGLSMLGYAGVTAGAYVGGDVVYRFGNMVDRHAFDSVRSKWQALDVEVIPEGQLVGAKAGSRRLVLHRQADRVEALDATCAHAGGPLDEGSLIDGCVQCPWHGSQFRLADGHVVHGPAVYDQPRFEVRQTPAGWEARLATTQP